MFKIKKIIYSLGTIGAIVAPVVTVVSCGTSLKDLQEKFGDQYRYDGDIQVITDAGTISDKSFNQSAFEAVADYANIVSGKSKTFGYSQPDKSSENKIQKAYLSSLKKGAKILVLPGFTHTGDAKAIDFADKYHEKYPNARYICIDGLAKDKIYGDGSFGSGEKFANSKGFYNLEFASQESGFLAAVAGGIFFNKVKRVTSEIKAETFGGVAIPYGVTSYMDGWLQGINWFNNNLKNKFKNLNWQSIKPIFMSGNKASISDFTGSFDAGGATSKVQTMLNNRAQMILPVAGPQTGDVVGAIAKASKKGKVFVFGVDTDQSKVYNPEYLIGSALKGVYAATSYAINVLSVGHRKVEFTNLNGQLRNKGDIKEYLDKLESTLKKKNVDEYDARIKTQLTGISISSAYRNEKIDDKIENPIWGDALNFVNDGNVAAGLKKGVSTSRNAIDTFTLYGGYLKVANENK